MELKKIFKSMKYYYIGNALLPVSTIMNYIIVNTFGSQTLYSIIGVLHLLFVSIPGYLIIIYNKEGLYTQDYLMGGYLNKYRFGTLLLVVGLWTTTFNPLLGVILFSTGYMLFSFFSSIIRVVSTGYYLNVKDSSDNLKKDNLNYQLSMVISSLFMILVYFINLEELTKFYVIFGIFYITLFLNFHFIKDGKRKADSNSTVKLRLKIIKEHIKSDIETLHHFSKDFKIYLLSTALANLGSAGVFYFVFFIKENLKIEFQQILIITLISYLVSFIWSFILKETSLRVKGANFLMIGRSLYGASIVIILFSTSFIHVILGYIVLRVGQLLTSLGKKKIVDKIKVGTKSNTEVYALIRAIQSLFGITSMLILLFFGSYFENALSILLVSSSLFYFLSVLTVYYLKKNLNAENKVII